MTLIETDDLSYLINGINILDHVSLQINRGEFVGVIGPNGAGKTTLLRLLIGYLTPSSGHIRFKDQLLYSYSLKERAQYISYLSQEATTFFSYPVLDIVLMGRYPFLSKFQREKESDYEKARRALLYVGLSGFEDRYFHELSGGERQLVLFARVMAQETELLVLDEPTSNLDIKHQDQLFSMAAELTREKKTVIASVHNLNVASRYCSCLYLLDRGSIAAHGDPSKVLRSDILDRVYGTTTTITPNMSTGALVVNVVSRARKDEGPRVHIIGGAGSAVNLTRELARTGCRLSGGVAHEHDTDEELWKSLEIETHVVSPFSRIGPEDTVKASPSVEDAEITVLCSFPIGTGNEENLRLAGLAKRLIIITPGPEDTPRTFFSETAENFYREISKTALHMTYGELVEELEAGSILDRFS